MSRKHHNLRHVLPPAEQAAALAKVGGGPAATLADAGERILSAKQKELQHLFELVYGCPTSSFNNEWLRRKLLTAVGLPPNWRPPPELAPDLPACRPEECSRYGRRRRRVASYALPESDSEEEVGSERDGSPAPRAIRRRTCSASLAAARREGSADSAGARPSPAAALAAEAAGWRSDGPACSGAGCGGASAGSPTSGGSTPSAIFAMQARAAAAFASQPAVPAAPGPMVPVQPLPQQPLSTVPMPAAQPARASSAAALPPLSLAPLVPAAPAAQQPAAFSWSAGRPLAMAPTQPTAAPSLAALLSKPGQAAAPAVPAPAPLAEQLLLQPASALESLSQQLHSLFEDWDAGNVSLLSFGTAL